MKPPRTKLPTLCNNPATFLYGGGYKVCGECRKMESTTGTRHTHDLGRCDRPTDGLGARRYQKPTN